MSNIMEQLNEMLSIRTWKLLVIALLLPTLDMLSALTVYLVNSSYFFAHESNKCLLDAIAFGRLPGYLLHWGVFWYGMMSILSVLGLQLFRRQSASCRWVGLYFLMGLCLVSAELLIAITSNFIGLLRAVLVYLT